jgi:hypothetical protein
MFLFDTKLILFVNIYSSYSSTKDIVSLLYFDGIIVAGHVKQILQSTLFLIDILIFSIFPI